MDRQPGSTSAPPFPAPMAMNGVPLLVVTRFSYLGRSGWKSESSRDAAQLFAPERLRLRLQLLRQITLPSLAAQTDQDFHHLLLTSDALPGDAAAELAMACAAAYPEPERFTILARPPDAARKPLRRFMQTHFGEGGLVAQIVLDDDDGLAADFIASLRAELVRLQQEDAEFGSRLPFLLSYPQGFGLILRGDRPRGLYRHRYPWINLGLTLLGTPTGRNVLGIAHRAAARRFGGLLLSGQPMFLRGVHDFNDSRVQLYRSWREVPDWRADPMLQARFPWLLAPGTLWS